MSDPTSIFNESNSGKPADTNNTNGNGVTAPSDSELTDLLNNIKNERGEPKYKSVKDAIIGLQNAQEYIPNLKQSLADREAELATLRAESKKVADLEDAVRQLTERKAPEGTPPKGISEQEIADLINKSLDTTLSKREQAAVQKQNVDSVVDTLKATFGADAEKKFYDKASELGMTVQEFNSLAAKSPKIVLTALGVTAKPQSFVPTQGSVNSTAFTPQTNSYIGRNQKPVLVGATTEENMQESRDANKMVEELHSQGKSVHDLSDPKVFFKHFGR
jgi:hypothetical protein